MPLFVFSTLEMTVIGITVGVVVFFAVYGVWGWLFYQRPQTTVLQIDPTEFTHTGEVRWFKALQDGQSITVKLFGKFVPEVEIYLWREREMVKLFFLGILACFTLLTGALAYLYQLNPAEFLEDIEGVKNLLNAFIYPGWIEGVIGGFTPKWLLAILTVPLSLWITLATIMLLQIYNYFWIERPLQKEIKDLKNNNIEVVDEPSETETDLVLPLCDQFTDKSPPGSTSSKEDISDI